MKNLTLKILPLALFCLTLNCGNSPTGPSDAALIQGRVVESDNLRPVADVLVRSASFAANTTTDENGKYSLTVQLADSAQRIVSLIFSKSGFRDAVVSPISIKNGTITNLPDAILAKTGDAAESSGQAASIVLTEIETDILAVRGSGGNESGKLTFEVRDSTGVPVDLANKVNVHFSITGGPLGGEFLAPDTVTSDISGLVTTTINSGTKAGALQIVAEIPGTGIASAPVPITVHGGLPDAAHFTVGSTKKNFAGFRNANLENTIIVIVGDKYSNPVQPGTAVQFQTSGGIIQGSATTDLTGRASVTLISGNPLPLGIPREPFPFDQPGYAKVTAQTVGENQQTIVDRTIVLFSGSTRITLNSPSPPYTIAAKQSLTFNYTVSDENGNPLVQGTTIRVATTRGDVAGDTNVQLDDFLVRGVGSTDFTFILTNNDPPLGTAEDAIVTIKVNGSDNGALTHTFVVTMQP